MMFGFVAFLTKGLSTSAISAVIGSIAIGIAIVVFSSWNLLIDNPRVTREARAQYVAIADFERAKAERDTVRKLLALSKDKALELQLQIAGYDEARLLFEHAAITAENEKVELQNELDELETGRNGSVPTVRQLGIVERLRNR